MYDLKARPLGHFDVAVCGGGVAGVGAAVAAARNGASVVLIEKSGALGGMLTTGLIPNIMDCANKGGLVKELLDFLNAHQMTCSRYGKRTDENGNRIPGCLIDVEGAKYFLEKACADAGVTLLYHSMLSAVDHTDGHINSILLATYCGNYSLSADIYIDATGYGSLAELTGLEWECGDPAEGRPNPASMSIMLGGLPADYDGTDSVEDKNRYATMLLENGIDISAQQATLVKLPSLQTWSMGFNFEYDVMPDDIHRLSDAILSGRKEAFHVVEGHKKISGYEKVYNAGSADYFGTREGRRVFGAYRLKNEDISEGRKFADGICLVTAAVDVHKLKSDDTTETQRGVYAKAYHIPFRCLVPLGSDNMLLAGRCLSGDFYPFASYRMMGNMMTVGEAAGFAAAMCAKEKTFPAAFDGTRASAYIRSLGHEL